MINVPFNRNSWTNTFNIKLCLLSWKKGEMITQLPVNELEHPLDGSDARGKRKFSCIPLTINTVLCLITCIATFVCVTYAF